MSRAEPPYLRIVADIRRRIAVGELLPGDRIPSVRAIAREWTVAIATATKAHATLRQQGLTEVVPGVGTVVAAPPPPKVRSARVPVSRRSAGERDRGPVTARPTREPGAELSRERIVAVAMHVADADGMAELSMRRVAAELDVATMSLYRYVASKDELVLHMIDAAFGEVPLPPPVPGGWRSELEQIARAEWAAFNRHPWLAPAMSITRPQLAPNALAVTDRTLHALAGTGLNTSDRLHVHVMLFSFVRGVASALEPEAEARRETGLTDDEWIQIQESRLRELASAGSPLLQVALSNDFEFDLATLFEFGLARLLDGLAAYLSGPTAGG